ncbi:MAG: type II toxin-antitoxin system RelE/ParE family toxin [Pyrinomonadaceae bacterium]
MSGVHFTSTATEDLNQIWLYLSLETDEDFADRFVDQIEEKCRSTALSPKGYRLRPELMRDLRSFPFKTYVIFYVPVGWGIEVFRVRHAAPDLEHFIDE